METKRTQIKDKTVDRIQDTNAAFSAILWGFSYSILGDDLVNCFRICAPLSRQPSLEMILMLQHRIKRPQQRQNKPTKSKHDTRSIRS